MLPMLLAPLACALSVGLAACECLSPREKNAWNALRGLTGVGGEGQLAPHKRCTAQAQVKVLVDAHHACVGEPAVQPESWQPRVVVQRQPGRAAARR